MLKVILDKNSVLTDYSIDMESFLTDEVALDIDPSTDALYLGLDYKPIDRVYVAMSTVNNIEMEPTVEYWDGSAWQNVTNLKDYSKGLSRDGFLIWDKVESEKVSVGSTEAYFFRITPSEATSSITFKGIGLLLSEDKDLIQFEPLILQSRYYPVGYTSFLPYHQSSLTAIVDYLRLKGYKIKNKDRHEKFYVWDLLDIEELEVASIYRVLATIYFVLSDSPEDKYHEKYQDYLGRFERSMEVFYLSVDQDSDGQVDVSEVQNSTSGLIVRV